jgi:hypothetical protein
MTLGHIGYWAAVTIGLGCLVVVCSLVVIRLHADAAERRRQELRTPLWRVVLTLGAGEPDEVDAATQRLLSLSPEELAARRAGRGPARHPSRLGRDDPPWIRPGG